MNRYYDLWVNPSHNPKNKTLAHLRFHTEGKGYFYVEGVGFSGFSLMLEPSQHRDFETLMENVMLPLQAFWEVYEKHLTSVEASRHLTTDEQRIMHSALRKSANIKETPR